MLFDFGDIDDFNFFFNFSDIFASNLNSETHRFLS